MQVLAQSNTTRKQFCTITQVDSKECYNPEKRTTSKVAEENLIKFK